MAHDRIIVGVDGSAGSERALRWAVEEGRFRGAEVRAVMAWGLLDQHPTPDGQQFNPRYGDDDATATLETYVAAALGDGAAGVELRAVNDLPARALLDAARDADLLVVGSRGLGGFRGLLLGSVSRRCANLASTPLVVVREVAEPDANGGRGIVVGVDGSESSLAALRWAVEEGGHRDQPVQVLHAWQEQAFGMDPYGMAVDATPWESAARLLLDTAIADVGATTARDSGAVSGGHAGPGSRRGGRSSGRGLTRSGPGGRRQPRPQQLRPGIRLAPGAAPRPLPGGADPRRMTQSSLPRSAEPGER